jgi:transposase, IS30 family
MKNYNHLSEEERNNIFILVNRKNSIREIAVSLGRSPSSISREIKKNFGKTRYRSHRAHDRAIENHHLSHKHNRLKSRVLRIEVEKMLSNGWSPEIVSGRLKKQSDLPTISPEAIYQWIYQDAPHLIGCLVRSHPARWPKRKSKNGRRIQIPNRVSITERPSYINERTKLGHWETDLLACASRSAIQVAVERKSRFTRLKKIPNKTANTSRFALYSLLNKFPEHLRQSITYDNGLENIEHETLNEQLNTCSYFCQPYHSWEKGSVENTNGLIRRFFPKKTNFDIISDDNIQKVESWLNDRPRKCLDFNTPAESLNSPVALAG